MQTMPTLAQMHHASVSAGCVACNAWKQRMYTSRPVLPETYLYLRPVFPEVASTSTVLPGEIRPLCSASAIMLTAARQSHTSVGHGRFAPLLAASARVRREYLSKQDVCMCRAPMRSLTLPPGLLDSSFATTRAGNPAQTRFSNTIGVPPTARVMSVAITIRGPQNPSEGLHELTGQRRCCQRSPPRSRGSLDAASLSWALRWPGCQEAC